MSNLNPVNGSRAQSSPVPEILQTPALISQSTEMSYASALQSSHFGAPDSSEAANGGSGFSRYLHALRRRWLISLVIALPLAAGAAYGAWVLQPQQYTTSFVLQIKHGEENLVFMTADQARGAAGSSVDTFKRTQRVAIRQRGLIERALDPELHPGLAKLPVLRNAAPDEVGWVEKHLSVTFPEDSEIMYVSLTADDPKGLHEILQSIVAEYFDSVVAFERDKKMERFTNLETTMTDAESELRKKRNDVKAIVERVGHADKQALSIDRKSVV